MEISLCLTLSHDACSAASSLLILRGIARGHRHRMHALGAQRIDRDAQRQRRIDAAGESQHHARKAVLVDIVARALHQRAVDAFLLALQRHDARRAAARRAARIRSSKSTTYMPSVNAGARIVTSPRASMTKELPSNTSSSWPPIKLTNSSGIPVSSTRAAHDLPLALRLLVHLVGRGIDDEQHLGAGRARLRARGLGLPDVLAHQNARLACRSIRPRWAACPGVK